MNPTHKVLSTMRKHNVAALLMGGQACVLYGAAEFSRDADLAIVSDAENLQRLQGALDELQAERIAVPPFDAEHLERGHAVHFRCRHPDVAGFRIDVMSRMRGVAEFPDLWARRTSVEVAPGEAFDVLSLPDLVAAKKTQRDKDWPMIRRLLEADYLRHSGQPGPERIRFWLRELRTPELLVEAAARYPDHLAEAISSRPLLRLAAPADVEGLARALEIEEGAERASDRRYWKPLRDELEQLRHQHRRG
jgi:hypothetical protein